jgi:hypothetical protein
LEEGEVNDRELLEMAAKAAGIGPKLCYESARNCLRIGDRKSYWLWSPLNDDGDALRLAVSLGIPIYGREIGCTAGGDEGQFFDEADFGGDIYAATRYAITSEAAEIGRGMK